jgi:hypothetical protein
MRLNRLDSEMAQEMLYLLKKIPTAIRPTDNATAKEAPLSG